MPRTKRRVDTPDGDFYPTPAWVTRALLAYETFQGIVLDPACGDGALIEVLRARGFPTEACDIVDRGFGGGGHDFLAREATTDTIITNPPYHLAQSFVLQALELTRFKFAFLLRTAFLESQERYFRIFEQTRPTRIWIFTDRVSMYPKNVGRDDGGTTSYAWFIWDMSDLGQTEVRWIPPGWRPNSKYATTPE